MSSCPTLGQFRFFSLILGRTFKILFSGWPLLLFIEVGIAESNTEGCSGSILLSLMIPGHPFTFQKLFIELKIFFPRQVVPVGFRCKPLLPRFIALIFLLSIMSISNWKRWLVSWLTVNVDFQSSVCKVGKEITILYLGRLSVIKDLSIKRVFNISHEVELGASFAPVWIMTTLSSLWSNGLKWCFMSSILAHQNLCNLTARPFPAQFLLYDSI